MQKDGETGMEIEKRRELGSQKLFLSKEEKSSGKVSEEKTDDFAEKEDFREKMLLENEIKGHLPFKIRRLNGRKIYEYDIEGLSSLEEEAERKLGFEIIKALVNGLYDTVTAGAPYLLREDDYVITPETVLFDKKDRSLKLVYCPGYARSLKNKLSELMEYCLDTIDYNDGPAVKITYGLYMKIRDSCSLQQLKESIDEVSDEPEGVSTTNVLSATNGLSATNDLSATNGLSTTNVLSNTNDLQSTKVMSDTGAYSSKYPDDGPSKLDEKRTPIMWIRDFWNVADKQVRVTLAACAGAYLILTIAVLSGKVERLTRSVAGIPVWVPVMIAATAVCVTLIVRAARPVVQFLMKSGAQPGAIDDNETVLMIGKGTQESLVMVSDGLPGLCTDRFPCVVGKEKGLCDLVVDAKGVSRKHFRIDRNSDGGVTVEDLNTVNGTFLNGHKLAPNMTFEVREGDEISFGSVSYYINHLD